MTCSEKSDMRLFSLSGKLLAVVEPSGLQVRIACHCGCSAKAPKTWGLQHAVHRWVSCVGFLGGVRPTTLQAACVLGTS